MQENELNSEVRELIQHVREQREIREQMNEIVREKKQARATASDAVRSAKEKLQALKGNTEARDGNDRRRGRDRPETVSSPKERNLLDWKMILRWVNSLVRMREEFC